MSRPTNHPDADVWLLLDDRPGHATQVRGLAMTLGLEGREIPLTFNALNRLPGPVLGASDMTLKPASRARLTPPWPRLVIAMGRRASPVARWIRQQSSGKSKVVLLGRKAVANEKDIDLAITCAHFNHVPQANMVELVVPPSQVTPKRMADIRAEQENPMPEVKRPATALLLGGPTAQHGLSREFASAMADKLKGAVAKTGGGLAVVTSRRTPEAVISAIEQALPEAHIHKWAPEHTGAPFLSYLAHADLLAVSGESESMLAEAAASGKPLTIIALDEKPAGFKLRLAGWLRRQAMHEGLVGGIARKVLGAGWITPPRDLSIMHRKLVDSGRARLFDGHLNQTPPAPDDGLDSLVLKIAALIDPSGSAHP